MIEKFSTGDKVYLIHLRETGTVTRLNGAEMVFVQLPDMEIPVYCTDITRTMPKQDTSSATGGNVVAAQLHAGNKPEIKKVQGMGTGIFLSFLPHKNKAGDIEHFVIQLVNDTHRFAAFRYRFFAAGNIQFSIDRVAAPSQVFVLHEIDVDLLNESPEFDLLVSDQSTTRWKAELVQKIKPQNFFNKSGIMPLTGEEAYIYKIPSREKQSEIAPPIPKSKGHFDLSLLKQMMMDSPVNKDHEMSEASNEVDLHIEKLTRDFSSMQSAEMLFIQIAKFQQSLDRAIAGGLHRFYAIHGNGTGKLKSEVHRILRNCKEVKSFNNNYHPKYSYGATEIILR